MGKTEGIETQERFVMIAYAVHGETGKVYDFKTKEKRNELLDNTISLNLEEAKQLAKEVDGKVIKYGLHVHYLGVIE